MGRRIRLSQLFQQEVVPFNSEILALRIGEAIIHRLAFRGHLGQVFQGFLLANVFEVIRARPDT